MLPGHEAFAAERVDYFMKQGPLDREVLWFGRLKQHRVQDGRAGEQTEGEKKKKATLRSGFI